MESLGVNPDFWRGRRVFITGHTGFVGSWLSLFLHALKADVMGYALDPPTEPNLFSLAGVAGVLVDERGDVANQERIAQLLRAHQSEIVVHLAAQALVRRSYVTPLETFRTNVFGTAAVLDAIRASPSVRAAVIVTSDKCYDLANPKARHRETDLLGGDDPYSASKAGAEYVVMGYRTAFWSTPNEMPAIATARSGNVIGGGDWSHDRLVPDLIAAFEDGKPATIRSPQAVRPWQHVIDPLRGYLALAERLWGADRATFASAWNFGPSSEDEWNVAQVADEAARIWGSGASWRVDEAPHPHEAPQLRLDSSKAESQLGWTAHVRLPMALRRTIEWHRKLASGGDARLLVSADIEELRLHAVRK